MAKRKRAVERCPQSGESTTNSGKSFKPIWRNWTVGRDRSAADEPRRRWTDHLRDAHGGQWNQLPRQFGDDSSCIARCSDGSPGACSSVSGPLDRELR